MSSETVDLDIGLLDAHLSDHQVRNLLSLIALELDNFAEFGVVDNGTVGGKFLFGKFEDTLRIDFLGKPLNGG